MSKCEGAYVKKSKLNTYLFPTSQSWQPEPAKATEFPTACIEPQSAFSFRHSPFDTPRQRNPLWISARRYLMASSLDLWMKEFNEASKLADDTSSMISERGSLPPSGPDTLRYTSAIRRKITIFGTKLDSLESLLTELLNKQPKMDKELHKRQEMLANLRSRAKQMASTLTSTSANREDLFGPSRISEINRTTGLDNQGIVGLQRQTMKEQDEGLEKLEETVSSTKHIALAVNEELDLHTRLLDSLDQEVDSTDSRLQRVQKKLGILNKRTKGACSCKCLLISVVVIVMLAAAAWALIKYV